MSKTHIIFSALCCWGLFLFGNSPLFPLPLNSGHSVGMSWWFLKGNHLQPAWSTAMTSNHNQGVMSYSLIEILLVYKGIKHSSYIRQKTRHRNLANHLMLPLFPPVTETYFIVSFRRKWSRPCGVKLQDH